jgi:hypothetical protein
MALRPASRFRILSHIFTGLSAALLLAGCHGNQPQTATSAADQTQDQAAQQSLSDPASANVIPVSNTGADNGAEPANPPASGSAGYDNGMAAPPTSPASAGQAPYDDSSDESDYGVAPEETAADAPPPLPDYDQPPCPGDGYIWTPGYWNYASAGYYWVPGAWVEAPYTGALWTPGYWASSHGRYAFFHGYWGPHIGFYGGVNYGYGYGGYGYQGGYWNGNRFAYNRSVNNVNVTVVHNVYNYKVVTVRENRVSFNGGHGGIQARPRAAELQALREPHAPPMRTQIEVRQSASTNRAQFVSANHGRPAEFIAPHPVAAERNVHPVVNSRLRNLPPPPRAANEARPEARPEAHPGPAPANHPEAGRPQPNRPEPNRPEPNRPEPNRAEPNHPAANHPEPGHPESRPAPPNHAQSAHPEPSHAQPAHLEPSHAAPNHPAPPPAHAEPNHAAPPAHHEAAPSHPTPEHTQPARHVAPPAQHAAPSHAQREHKPTPEEKKDKDEHPHS